MQLASLALLLASSCGPAAAGPARPPPHPGARPTATAARAAARPGSRATVAAPAPAAAAATDPRASPSAAWDVAWRHPCTLGAESPIAVAPGDDVLLACGGRFSVLDGRWLAPSSLELPLALLDAESGVCRDESGLGLRGCREGGPAGPRLGTREVLAAAFASPGRLVAVEEEHDGHGGHVRLFAVTRRWPAGEVESSAELPAPGDITSEGVSLVQDAEGRVLVALRPLVSGPALLARLEGGSVRPVALEGLPAEAPSDVVVAADGSAAIVRHGARARVVELGAPDTVVATLELGIEEHLLAVGPAADTLALRRRDADGGWLQVLARGVDPRGGTTYSRVGRHPLGTDIDRARFAGRGRVLVVAEAWLAGLSPGPPATPPARADYPGVAPPAGWHPTPPITWALYPPGVRWTRARELADVRVTALAPLVVTPDDDLEAWAVAVARLHAGVELVRARRDPRYAVRAWREADGGRQLELVVPACHEGVSNSDGWLRVAERGGVRWDVGLVTDPGERRSRVSAWLAAFVDGPLGAGPTPRVLPNLPRRHCGI